MLCLDVVVFLNKEPFNEWLTFFSHRQYNAVETKIIFLVALKFTAQRTASDDRNEKTK